MRRARTGFTLLEALAAVVVLGLLATAAVPLLHRLGDSGLDQRLQAQALLRSLALPERLPAGTVIAVPGHPGWNLEISALAPEPEPPPPAGTAPPAAPPHRWLLLAIRDARGATLADTLVADLGTGKP